jgi:hypothetical protein
LSYGAAATAFVLVLVLVPRPLKILIHEDEYDDEYEKNKITCNSRHTVVATVPEGPLFPSAVSDKA